MQDLKSLFEKLQAAKGVHELQQGGSLLVQKVRQLRESNEKDIREKIEMLKGESEAALSKVYKHRYLVETYRDQTLMYSIRNKHLKLR